MNADERDLKKVLEGLPPHYWFAIDLTKDDLPVLLQVKNDQEHLWSNTEKWEVEVLIKRLEGVAFFFNKPMPTKIDYIKAVYGHNAYERKKTIQYGNEIICAWVLIGYNTIAELEKTMNDKEIQETYEAQLLA